MKKIILCFPFVGDSVGGSHISSLILVKELAKSEIYHPLVFLHKTGVLSDYLDTNNIQYIVVNKENVIVNDGPILKQIVKMVRAALSLYSVLLKHQIKIIHTNDIRMHYTWLLAAKVSRCKFVWHQRTADDSRRNSWYSFFSDAIITISEHCKSSLPSLMSKHSAVVYDPFIFDSIDYERMAYRKATLEDICPDENCFLVIYVGKFTKQKRPKLFLDIANIVKRESNKKVIFCMFGNSKVELDKDIKEYSKKLNIDDVLILKGVKQPIQPWINASDLLVAPAINEGLGRTLVEAQALNVAVVATNHGGHVEVIQHGVTGYLADDNPESFANHILSLINDEGKKNQIVKNAKAHANKEFSVVQHINKVLSIYDAVLK